MNPTAKITSSHLSRLVIVYVRQSTMAQVRQNTESTSRRYGPTGTAAELGWLAEQIVVVDADLGVSGRFGSARDGYREIAARMCMGEVGAVFGLEVSRFGRSNADDPAASRRTASAARRDAVAPRHGRAPASSGTAAGWYEDVSGRGRTRRPARIPSP